MADVILLESSVLFDVAEWIGVGKLYKDIPIEVSDACCDARTIPADLQVTFPSRATPTTEFLALWLPVILDDYQTTSTQMDHWFSFEPPNYDPIPTLWSNSIPTLSFLCKLENDYPQKWMNGVISVLDPCRNPYASLYLLLCSTSKSIDFEKRKTYGVAEFSGHKTNLLDVTLKSFL
ncbi:hypothetical protein B0H14DRAFT_3525155 [Mycena olivaceomarginata]|nr:hypothetical protein B0H14DRAFT_3525155 [Mycena olivaceomarginata]